MGLDMYLTRTKKVPTNKEPEGVGYWRKSNHIHKWFVDNCQDGVDECQETQVSKEKLEELLVTCMDVLNNKDNTYLVKKELPTQPGFFFGGTEYDEGYYFDIEDTIKILQKVLAETDFEESVIIYQSSW